MAKYTVSFLGRDCPGIVAAITNLFGALQCNIEAMTQTMLSGEFAAIFIVDDPCETNSTELKARLERGLKEEEVDLSVLVRQANGKPWNDGQICAPFVVTVDGPDGPGLIGGMSKVFARHGINIENLKAILNEKTPGSALFVFEIMVPESIDSGRLRRELECEAQKLNLRVTMQHRDIFEAVNRVTSV